MIDNICFENPDIMTVIYKLVESERLLNKKILSYN